MGGWANTLVVWCKEHRDEYVHFATHGVCLYSSHVRREEAWYSEFVAMALFRVRAKQLDG
jgi:hypothetical protein